VKPVGLLNNLLKKILISTATWSATLLQRF
jgi:hypothetical protein